MTLLTISTISSILIPDIRYPASRISGIWPAGYPVQPYNNDLYPWKIQIFHIHEDIYPNMYKSDHYLMYFFYPLCSNLFTVYHYRHCSRLLTRVDSCKENKDLSIELFYYLMNKLTSYQLYILVMEKYLYLCLPATSVLYKSTCYQCTI